MEYTPENYELVKKALTDCGEYLKTMESIPDGGTCNFDTVTINFERWPKSKVANLPFVGNKYSSKWWRHNWALNFDYRGCANLRNMIAERANAFLKDRGVNSCIYYQMD